MTAHSTSTPGSSASGPGPAGGVRRRWLAVVGGVLTLLVLAVTSTALSSEPAPGPAAGSPGTASAQPATAFTAATFSGEEISVPGGRPSVVFFFAASCATCGTGARALAETQARIPDVNYVAVDVDPGESVDVVREFLAANDASTLAYARDTGAALTRAYQLTQLSTAVVLDASGTEVYRGVDPTPAQISSALAEAGAT
jgi:peroxiredoxin